MYTSLTFKFYLVYMTQLHIQYTVLFPNMPSGKHETQITIIQIRELPLWNAHADAYTPILTLALSQTPCLSIRAIVERIESGTQKIRRSPTKSIFLYLVKDFEVHDKG